MKDEKDLPSHEEIKQAAHEMRRPSAPRPRPKAKRHWTLGTLLLCFAAVSVVHFALGAKVLPFPEAYLPAARRVTTGAMAMLLVLTLEQAIGLWFISRLHDPVTQFNLQRVARLMSLIFLTFIFISVLFANWYTAAVSLGLISLVLGFALQTPITSFIGWIYILVRKPYRVGDRIEIGGASGDVIDVSYLDTTLWEFRGPYLTTDQPSGRLIKFPNSNVLSTPVFNYSWPLFPYVWNEVSFHLAYESDLKFIKQTLQSVTEEELGGKMTERVIQFRELLKETPVDELNVTEKPAVFFRVNANTWIEAIVRYLVHPKEASDMKNRLIERILQKLNESPDKALFPKSNAR